MYSTILENEKKKRRNSDRKRFDILQPIYYESSPSALSPLTTHQVNTPTTFYFFFGVSSFFSFLCVWYRIPPSFFFKYLYEISIGQKAFCKQLRFDLRQSFADFPTVKLVDELEGKCWKLSNVFLWVGESAILKFLDVRGILILNCYLIGSNSCQLSVKTKKKQKLWKGFFSSLNKEPINTRREPRLPVLIPDRP